MGLLCSAESCPICFLGFIESKAYSVIGHRRHIGSLLIFYLLFLIVLIVPLESLSKSLKSMNAVDLYPNDILFNVMRNNEIIGRHLVSFSQIENEKFRVLVRLNLEVKFLLFSVYKFDYKSDAIWLNGELKSLHSTQIDDGEIINVNVFHNNENLIVKTRDTEISTNLDAIPTNHWNIDVLKKKAVINTLTGEISSVEIAGLGKEKIKAQGKIIFANKYKYTGDIQVMVWYTDGGNWVKMQFEGKDGSTIEYLCVECGLRETSRLTIGQ